MASLKGELDRLRRTTEQAIAAATITPDVDKRTRHEATFDSLEAEARQLVLDAIRRFEAQGNHRNA
ncbi:MAG: hypothetical protein ACTSWI_04145 [Alphaproteobacteria bacterium]